jgi:hypothetical protein
MMSAGAHLLPRIDGWMVALTDWSQYLNRGRKAELPTWKRVVCNVNRRTWWTSGHSQRATSPMSQAHTGRMYIRSHVAQ